MSGDAHSRPRARLIAYAILLVSMLAIALLVWVRSTERRLSGKPLRHWLAALEAADPETRRLAADVLRASGTNSIPHLVELVTREETGIEEFRREALAMVRIRSESRVRADQRRTKLAFRALGDAATNAIPRLLEMFKDERMDGFARDLFVTIGEPGLNVLVTLLSDPDTDLRRNATRTLGEMELSARDALPALIRNAHDADEDVRYWTVISLARIGGPPELMVPVFIAGLEDPKPGIYENSARALGKLGSAAVFALPALTNALSNPDVRAEAEAAMSLIKADLDR